jgi:hypothetical protein
LSGHTRFSSLVYDWERLYQLELPARYLWMGLLMSAPAKRLVPGLWHGSVVTMADALRRPVDETANALDVLIESDLVEFDAKNRVLRMTEFPDASEWPSSPYIIESWFGRFNNIPDCPVRNAHVTTLRWLLDRGAAGSDSKKSKGRPSEKHEEVWVRTFGTILVPVVRRRGVRRMVDLSDTSTDVQPSLFGLAEGGATPSGSPIGSPSAFPSSSGPICASASSSSQPIENSDRGVPGGVPPPPGGGCQGGGSGEGEGEGVFSFSSPDPEGAGYGASRPTLTLVPAPGPFTVADLAAVFAGPRWPTQLPEATSAALARSISELRSVPTKTPTLALVHLRNYVERGGLAGISPEQLALPNALATALEKAFAWQRDSDAQVAALREVLQNSGAT